MRSLTWWSRADKLYASQPRTLTPTRTTIPSMMARVSGRRMLNVVPLPSSDCISTCPYSASMLLFTTSMPTPRPDTSVTVLAVDEPGANVIDHCLVELCFLARHDEFHRSAGLLGEVVHYPGHLLERGTHRDHLYVVHGGNTVLSHGFIS
jgi:hypothetical protein